MSFFTIIKLFSYVYFGTSIMLPNEMMDLTAQFLSLVVVPINDHTKILPHVFKSVLLLVRFVVLFTILGGNAIYSFAMEHRDKKPTVIKQKPITALKLLAGSVEQPKNESITIIKKEAAPDNTPMHSSAHLLLQPTNTKIAEQEGEPMTANLKDNNGNALNDKSLIDEPAVVSTNNPVTEEIQLIETNTAPATDSIIQNNDEFETLPELVNNKENNNIHSYLVDATIVNNEIMNKEPCVEQSGQDQLTTDEKVPTIADIDNEHVIPPDANDLTMDQEIVQHEKSAAEPSIPILSNKSDHSEEEEEEERKSTTTTTSTTITPPAEPSSDDCKEKYYSDLINKNNNLMSLSDNLQRIFDEPSTPNPQLDASLLDNTISYEDNQPNKDPKQIVNKSTRRISLQQSMEEMIPVATPALTPTQAGSTSSRRSSVTSTKSHTLKKRLSIAVQKARGGPSHKPQQAPPQQTLDSNFTETSKSSSLLNQEPKKSRFSTLRLNRRKSKTQSMMMSDPFQLRPHEPVSPPVIEVKASISSKLGDKFKKSGKRLSRFFS